MPYQILKAFGDKIYLQVTLRNIKMALITVSHNVITVMRNSTTMAYRRLYLNLLSYLTDRLQTISLNSLTPS